MREDLTEAGEGELAEPAGPGALVEARPSPSTGFGFRWSFQSVTAVGGKTHVYAREQRFSEGRLETEELEATLDGGAYERAARDASRAFAEQMGLLLRAWSWPFAPPLGPRRPDGEGR